MLIRSLSSDLVSVPETPLFRVRAHGVFFIFNIVFFDYSSVCTIAPPPACGISSTSVVGSVNKTLYDNLICRSPFIFSLVVLAVPKEFTSPTAKKEDWVGYAPGEPSRFPERISLLSEMFDTVFHFLALQVW